MKTKCAEEIVPNTWGDLIDLDSKTYNVTDEGVVEVDNDPTFYDLEIDSITNVPFGKVYIEHQGEVIEDTVYRLSSYISKIPHGIVDKRRPGIGATTLEINAKRNSIIVVPTKILAYNKAQKHPQCQYVGSKINNERGATSKAELFNYLNSDIGYKKIIVVADSLKRVTDLIGEEVYKTYFLLVDEVDMLQSDSNYRPALENVMDYYFRFDKRNRCLLTATMVEFSNPCLKHETRFYLTDGKPKRNIKLIHTDNINALVKKEIEKNTNEEKILIAYNSITQILGIIYNLDSDLQKKCSILCSEASEKEAGEFYAVLNNNKLPSSIVFMTCSYFAGVDIEDEYHLVTVSNAEKFFQILSIDKMTQIAGRCRLENGLLSETIIYNTPKKIALFDDGTFQEMLLNKADKVLDLYKAADKISKNDTDLVRLFSIVKKAIQEKATEKIGGEEISLTRPNIDGKYVPAYFNIDSIVEKMKLDTGYYMIPEWLKNELAKSFNIVSYISINEEINESQMIAEEKSIQGQKQQLDNYVKEAIAIIEQLEATGGLNDDELKKLIRSSKRNTRDFYERFMKLYKYADNNIIISELWDIRAENKKSFKDINNAVIFWALEDSHPLKTDISYSLIKGNLYSSDDLKEILKPITAYHLFKNIKPRASVSLIKAFYSLDRPKSKYKVIGENPKGFTEHKMRISKDENLTGLILL